MVAATRETEALAPTAEDLRPLFYLDPTITYLNHGSFGATPRPVMEESFRWQLEMEREPVSFVDGQLDLALDAARDRLAPLVGAPADDLVFVTNATIGLNIVIRSLDLKAGDEILTTNHEYGALLMSWDHYCQKVGASIVQQTLPLPFEDPEAIVDALFAGVTERTRVIFFSHITSPTALTLPAELICARARELGIFTMIDGAHVVGQREIDLPAMGCDVYSSNCHKWLMTPKGSAFLYVRPEHQEWIEATTVSWGWAEGWGTRATGRTYSQFVRRNQWAGTRDCSPFLATPDGDRFPGAVPLGRRPGSLPPPGDRDRRADPRPERRSPGAAVPGRSPLVPPTDRDPVVDHRCGGREASPAGGVPDPDPGPLPPLHAGRGRPGPAVGPGLHHPGGPRPAGRRAPGDRARAGLAAAGSAGVTTARCRSSSQPGRATVS
jgi:isopenicillin-N epimerase